ncbi:hypothetical protein L1987_06322 [Smallanthus sonchifolius]|uniref:Uncharacterized protein n=1 Tax=Smallanthus sonchifolius TaxID=185202 RepID=A0ACB9JXS9_9ASTR|nr:hypothetical protein L1987_06322 [Smallanthus sonchifolius]
MFDNLVNLYTNVFTFQWHHYTHSMSFHSPPTGVPLPVYAARCYISMWFVDLYASNLDVVRKLSYIAYNKYYEGELFQISHKYDHYLALLNASIRPTYLEHNLDDALYIPIVVESFNANDSNPFGINNFTPLDLCYKFARMMKGRGVGPSTSLSNNDAMGRPWWLFDWHSDEHVCSWFSQEGNYDIEDVTLAYILGTACTPNLGPRDVDEWQYFAEGVVSQDLNPLNYDRVAERGFYGSHEVRTMEIDTNFCLTRAIAAATTNAEGNGDQSGEEDYVLTPRFKLIDWLYHHRVIYHIDKQARDIMHSLFGDISTSLW